MDNNKNPRTNLYRVAVGGHIAGVFGANNDDEACGLMASSLGFKPNEYKQSMPGYDADPEIRYSKRALIMSKMWFDDLDLKYWDWPYLMYAIKTLGLGDILYFVKDGITSVYADYLYASLTTEELIELFPNLKNNSRDDIWFWICSDYEGDKQQCSAKSQCTSIYYKPCQPNFLEWLASVKKRYWFKN